MSGALFVLLSVASVVGGFRFWANRQALRCALWSALNFPFAALLARSGWEALGLLHVLVAGVLWTLAVALSVSTPRPHDAVPEETTENEGS